MARNAQSEQRGFVRCRQLAQHVLEHDTRMRIEAVRDCFFAIPAAVFLNLTAAFPSADHAFLFEPMEQCGIPEGAVSFVRYAASTLVVVGAGGMESFTNLTSGVLQGSPLSALLFVLATDLILEQLSLALDPVGGMLRACADDIGTVLRALE